VKGKQLLAVVGGCAVETDREHVAQEFGMAGQVISWGSGTGVADEGGGREGEAVAGRGVWVCSGPQLGRCRCWISVVDEVCDFKVRLIRSDDLLSLLSCS
jgi:hypothetical protein